MRLVLLILLSNFAFAKDKVALIVGDDCHELGKERIMDKANAKAAKAFQSKGFQVTSFFGNQARSKEMHEQFIKDPSIQNKSFSLYNIQKKLKEIYSKSCEQRPNQLMLNFVSHGSFNKGNHTICTHRNSKGKIPSIRVSSIANYIKSLQSSDCDKPRLAVVDCSCKSGGSVEKFKGMGCVMSSTSTKNPTKYGFITDYIEKIESMPSNTSLTDLHLDMLLNRDYSLAEYNDEKKLIEMAFDDSNQISGCYDEEGGDYNIGLSKNDKRKYFVKPICYEPTAMLAQIKELELQSIESILSKLNVKNSIDRAVIQKKVKGFVPKAESIEQILKQAIQENRNSLSRVKESLKEEAKIFSHPSMNRFDSCPISIPMDSENVNRAYRFKLREAMKNNDSSSLEKKRNVIYSFCSHINGMKVGLNYKNCIENASKGEIQLNVSQIMKLQKRLNLQENYKKIEKSLKDFSSKQSSKTQMNKYALRDLFKKTLHDCASKQWESGDENIKDALSFINYHYRKKNNKKCNDDSIECYLNKAKIFEKKIKGLLGITRAYFFLNCQREIDKKPVQEIRDLKSCSDFKF